MNKIRLSGHMTRGRRRRTSISRRRRTYIPPRRRSYTSGRRRSDATTRRRIRLRGVDRSYIYIPPRRRSYIPPRRRSYTSRRRRSYTSHRRRFYATTRRRRFESYAPSYRPYLADWDLDGDLDLAILSESPLFDVDVHPRFFEHHANHSVSELRGGLNSSCPLNWSHPFSVTDFDGDGQLDVVGMRGTDFIDLEVLVCLQSSAGYVVMNQAGSVPAIPQLQRFLISE